MEKLISYQIPSLSQQKSGQEIEVLYSTIIAEPSHLQQRVARPDNLNISNEISFQELPNSVERMNNISNESSSNIQNTNKSRADRYALREKRSQDDVKESNLFLQNKRNGPFSNDKK